MSGRGTSGGVVFQAEVCAYAAGLLLAECPLSRVAGGLPVQAKRTVNSSAKPGSDLACVADQFVRQYHHGVIEAGTRRDFDPSRDRLVLAVGTTTAATVANNLREALDWNRTGAATAIPNSLTSALAVFAELIDLAWGSHM